ncbi:Hypothetical predicted protein [Marmota monax]|uniref:Interleukin-1 n=1 Tax=Marmota monax TaxID=9995 RepID=A0A5E4D113_MARMO|nr:hypothetical protein GHT09_009639 [Marmota monax]VTJ87807.1 Hypothetical predicted protein [Marmota monax]
MLPVPGQLKTTSAVPSVAFQCSTSFSLGSTVQEVCSGSQPPRVGSSRPDPHDSPKEGTDGSNETGRTSTFESVAFPGWFIAVCSKGDCPLFMTQELGKTYITDFELIRQN